MENENSTIVEIKTEPVNLQSKCAEIHRNNVLGTYTFMCYGCDQILEASDDIFKHLDMHYYFEGMDEEHLVDETYSETGEEDGRHPAEYLFQPEFVDVVHSEQNTNNNNPSTTTTTNEIVRYKCKICSKTFSEKREYIIHLENHNIKISDYINVSIPKFCELCNVSFNTKQDVILHNITVHNNSGIEISSIKQDGQSCTDAGAVDSGAMEEHSSCDQNESDDMIDDDADDDNPNWKKLPLRKKLKEIQFKNKHDIELLKHLTTKQQQQPNQNQITFIEEPEFQCEICHLAFDTSRTLTSHMEFIHGNRHKYDCQLCSKQYANVKDLKLHMKNVHKQNVVPSSPSDDTAAGDTEFKCEICHQVFGALRTLTTHIGFAHENRPRYDCVFCHKKYANRRDLRFHIKKTHNNNERTPAHQEEVKTTDYSCEICGVFLSSAKVLATHVRIVHATERLVYQCKHCEKNFAYSYNIKKHYKKEHPDVMPVDFNDENYAVMIKNEDDELSYLPRSVRVKIPVLASNENEDEIQEQKFGITEVNETDPFDASTLDEEQESGNVLSNSYNDDTIIGYTCNTCKKEFSKYRCFTSHRLREHNADETTLMQCKQCNKTFAARSTFSEHVQKEHPNMRLSINEYKCKICLNEYAKRDNFKRHMKTHSGLEFSCDICPKVFSTKSKLTLHMAVHDPNTLKHVCTFCGHKFRNNANLNVHLRIHTGEKPHECSECKMRFGHRSAMVRHIMTIHKRVKRHQCELCGQGFYGAYYLGEHMKRHTNYKPVKCTYCEETFYNRKMQRVHERKHTGEKPYVCKECGSAFRTYNGYADHIILHTGVKAYDCRYCEMKFAQASGRRSHEKKKHGVE